MGGKINQSYAISLENTLTEALEAIDALERYTLTEREMAKVIYCRSYMRYALEAFVKNEKFTENKCKEKNTSKSVCKAYTLCVYNMAINALDDLLKEINEELAAHLQK